MNKEKLMDYIRELNPGAVVDDEAALLTVTLSAGEVHAMAQKLKDYPGNGFDHLSSLTAVDWEDHFQVVYHLYSFSGKMTIVLKGKLEERESPLVESVSDIWKGAALMESEVYDLFGIRFKGHPGLKRLFLGEDWEGFPLRKDYSDEINIIER